MPRTKTPASPASTADVCVDCGWLPEPGQLWPTYGGLACRWIQENLILAEGDSFGKPFLLRQDQKAFIWRWYEYCPHCDTWRYDEALRGAARGDGKTALVAALGVLEFGGPPQLAPISPNVVVAAASWDQANLLYAAASTMMGGRDQDVEEAPLCGFFEVYDGETKLADGRPGRLFRTATVAGTNQGGQPTLLLADEIHEFGAPGSPRAKFHDVVSKSCTKRLLTYRIPLESGEIREVRRGPGRVIDLSTAGDDVDHSFLGLKYKRGLREMHQGEPTKFLFDWRQARPGLDYTRPEDRAIACRDASGAADVIWSVDTRVREWDKDEVRHSDWRRYFANEWVDVADESWLADHPGAWDACKGEWTLTGTEPAVLAVDMALKHDSVAVAEVRELADGRRAVTAKIWYPGDGNIDHVAVFEWIKARAGKLGTAFQGLVYDPRFFQLPAMELEDEGYMVIEMPQSPERMAPAVGLTYDSILSGALVHDGDPDLAAQVKAANKRPGERGFTLSKGRSRKHIDAAVAMCMGVWTSAELSGQMEPSITECIW
ncbi:terminase TerL endonuclease subunit [Streptacidiphilus albus]|uniref:terminase TerL endonuclease subunit n=1 Tax=Streptacidiphilus albus TaxID=105425 RepID=UPI00054BE818|nr:terminase TerL endonuclease subunit [Streptacidiphilus albus]